MKTKFSFLLCSFALMVLVISFAMLPSCGKGGGGEADTVNLISPGNLSYVNAIINNAGPTFTWQANQNAASYVLAICYNDSSIGCGTTYVVSAPTTSKTIPVISTADGTYYWSVTPKDINGVSGKRSSVYSFTLDTIGPTIISTVPISDGTATNVSKFAPITVTFSEPITAATISSTSFTVYSLSTGTVGGIITSNAENYMVTFTPSQFLLPNTQYTTKITTAVTDIAGNPLQVPVVLAFWTSATSIYWTEGWGVLPNYYSIRGVGSNGGVVGTLASGLRPADIAVDSTNIYWTDSSGTVMTMLTSGGTSTTFASGLSNPADIAVDSTNVYWTECGSGGGSGTVKKELISGGAPTILASGQLYPHGIVVDATNAYWAEGDGSGSGTVKKVLISGGTPTTLVSGLNYPTSITVDSMSVYWTEYDEYNVISSGAVKKVALNGGTPTTLVSGLNIPNSIAVDSTNVYWADSYSGSVNMIPISGGTQTTLASGLNYPTSIVADSTSVYWTECDQNNVISTGAVKKVPLSGGTPTTIVTGLILPGHLAIGP